MIKNQNSAIIQKVPVWLNELIACVDILDVLIYFQTKMF